MKTLLVFFLIAILATFRISNASIETVRVECRPKIESRANGFFDSDFTLAFFDSSLLINNPDFKAQYTSILMTGKNPIQILAGNQRSENVLLEFDASSVVRGGIAYLLGPAIQTIEFSCGEFGPIGELRVQSQKQQSPLASQWVFTGEINEIGIPRFLNNWRPPYCISLSHPFSGFAKRSGEISENAISSHWVSRDTILLLGSNDTKSGKMPKGGYLGRIVDTLFALTAFSGPDRIQFNMKRYPVRDCPVDSLKRAIDSMYSALSIFCSEIYTPSDSIPMKQYEINTIEKVGFFIPNLELNIVSATTDEYICSERVNESGIASFFLPSTNRYVAHPSAIGGKEFYLE